MKWLSFPITPTRRDGKLPIVNGFVATVYYSYDDNPITDDMKIILFNYYNFSGTPQTEEHKNMLKNLIKNE